MFAADLVDTGGPVLGKVRLFSTLAALAGIAVTSVFLIKPIERRDRIVMRMGVDCLAVLIMYVGSVFMQDHFAQPMRGRLGSMPGSSRYCARTSPGLRAGLCYRWLENCHLACPQSQNDRPSPTRRH